MTTQETQRPYVGVGVIIRCEGKVLMGKRKGSHGAGHWSFPGGHLEFGETIEACACRELSEETGLEASRIELGPYTSDLFEQKHYVTIFVYVDQFEGTLQLMEPDKCERWEWCDPKNLPLPLFTPVQSVVYKLYAEKKLNR